jgi:hypothetical protein
MGRQYGALAKDDLQAMHTTIGKVFLNNEKIKMTQEDLNTIARAVFDRYPQRYKEILYGMAETSGLRPPAGQGPPCQCTRMVSQD